MVDSHKKINYQELLPKECFYSSIDDGKRGKSDGHISDEQYLHLKNVWNTFNFNIFRDFHNHVNKRYSKANNKYCPEYDKTKPEKHIAYTGMNHLYRGAMSEYLPYGGFKLVKTTNETINRILNKSDHSLHGYFLEVDLEYAENLHDFCKDYPMAPEKIKIKDENKR